MQITAPEGNVTQASRRTRGGRGEERRRGGEEEGRRGGGEEGRRGGERRREGERTGGDEERRRGGEEGRREDFELLQIRTDDYKLRAKVVILISENMKS